MMRGALIVGLLVVIATWSIAVGAPDSADAIDTRNDAVVSSDGGDDVPVDRAAQADEAGDDTSMEVMLWTVLAAGIAAGVGLVLYIVRVLLGRVQTPAAQQQEDAHH